MEPVSGHAKECSCLTFEQLCKLPDSELMAHLQAGRNDAIAVLFERYHRLILSVAFKILRDMQEAEDVMQSIFLEICKVAGQFDPTRGTAKVWLLQYAYHRSMNRRKYLKVRGLYFRGSASARPAPAAGNSGGGALGLLTLPEVRCLVREGLKSLSSAQQSVLHMAYFEDMPLKDIAVRTGETLGNVRHHYYRALSRLRSLLLRSDGTASDHQTREDQYAIAHRGSLDVET